MHLCKRLGLEELVVFYVLVVPGEKHVRAVVLGCRKTLVDGGGQILCMHLSMNVENTSLTFWEAPFRAV